MATLVTTYRQDFLWPYVRLPARLSDLCPEPQVQVVTGSDLASAGPCQCSSRFDELPKRVELFSNSPYLCPPRRVADSPKNVHLICHEQEHRARKAGAVKPEGEKTIEARPVCRYPHMSHMLDPRKPYLTDESDVCAIYETEYDSQYTDKALTRDENRRIKYNRRRHGIAHMDPRCYKTLEPCYPEFETTPRFRPPQHKLGCGGCWSAPHVVPPPPRDATSWVVRRQLLHFHGGIGSGRLLRTRI